MAWNGSGTFTRTDGTRSGTQVWQDARDAGVKILASDHDTHDQDIADGLENTVALDGQNTTTTDNAILRYDVGNSQFEGVSISASQIVGRSASGDTRAMDAATARQTIGLGTAAATNDKLLAFSSASNQFVETSYTSTDIDNVTGVITTEGDLMIGDGSGDESRLAIGSNNQVPISNGTTLSYGLIDTSNIATDAVTSDKIASGAVGTSELAASSVDQNALGANSAGRSEIKEGSASSAGSLNAGNAATINLNDYALFPAVESDTASVTMNAENATSANANSGNPRFDLKNDSGGSINYDVAWRHIAS